MSDDLIPQPHGGSLRPWTSGGQGSGAAANRSSFKALKRQAARRMADYVPEAVDETIRLALYDPDSRVRTINLQEVLNRGLGKATHMPAPDDGRVVDISHLSAEDQRRLDEAFAVIHELLGIGPGGAAK